MDDRVVGLLGGGQLGRMFVEAAHRFNIKVVVLDTKNAPAKQINALHPHIDGSFAMPDDVRELSRQSDILTVEIEHVDTQVLEEIATSKRAVVQPSWRTIRVIQDKYTQKEHLMSHGIATAESKVVESPSEFDLLQVGKELGFPFMLKSRTQAYDGRGNYPVNSEEDIHDALETLKDRPLYAETWAHFKMELAVMVVKTYEDDSVEDWETYTVAYPVVETVHEDSICKLVYAPARGISSVTYDKAQELARRAVSSFWGKGVFGVEMFLLEDDTILINEIAPRPHNSGHYTIEACQMSQYEAHLRAILDLDVPQASTDLITSNTCSIMLNILGGARPDSHLVVGKEALRIPGARIHLYGKGDARPGRKMGHITVTAASMKGAERKIKPLITCVDKIREDHKKHLQPRRVLTKKLEQTVESIESSSETISKSTLGPVVGITMGSDSDLPVLKPGIALLDDLAISYEVTITSAHRTPKRMLEYAEQAASRGLKVIIAAAGGAAHLPGMLASSTPLPVIGVPVKATHLDGMDSLLSINQMPRGVPVATVAINNSINAALLAARIIGTSDISVRRRIEEYVADMEKGVLEKAERLEEVGWKHYGAGK